eukprot:753398-Prorocentrum_minimum.AAC.1
MQALDGRLTLKGLTLKGLPLKGLTLRGLTGSSSCRLQVFCLGCLVPAAGDGTAGMGNCAPPGCEMTKGGGGL